MNALAIIALGVGAAWLWDNRKRAGDLFNVRPDPIDESESGPVYVPPAPPAKRRPAKPADKSPAKTAPTKPTPPVVKPAPKPAPPVVKPAPRPVPAPKPPVPTTPKPRTQPAPAGPAPQPNVKTSGYPIGQLVLAMYEPVRYKGQRVFRERAFFDYAVLDRILMDTVQEGAFGQNQRLRPKPDAVLKAIRNEAQAFYAKTRFGRRIAPLSDTLEVKIGFKLGEALGRAARADHRQLAARIKTL